MGYHPETLAFSFPPYDSKGGWLYRLKPWIGFDIWHIDPEHAREGQRADDSCGWFDRTPGPYTKAVTDFLKDTSDMHEVKLALARRKHTPAPFYEGISEPPPDPDRAPGWPRLSQADTLAVVLMVATTLERARWWAQRRAASWWRRSFVRLRDVTPLALSLSLSSVDNLSSVERPDSMVRLIAAALHREFRPWWKHPRWHVHHWQVNFDLARNLKRMVQPCGTCGHRLGFGYCPTDPGDGSLHHGDCLHGRAAGVTPPEAA